MVYVSSHFLSLTTLKFYADSAISLLRKHDVPHKVLYLQDATLSIDNTYINKYEYYVGKVENGIYLEYLFKKYKNDAFVFLNNVNTTDTTSPGIVSNRLLKRDNDIYIPYLICDEFRKDIGPAQFYKDGNVVTADVRFFMKVDSKDELLQIIEKFDDIVSDNTQFKIHIVISYLGYTRVRGNRYVIDTDISVSEIKRVKKSKNLIVTVIYGFMSREEISKVYRAVDFYIQLRNSHLGRMIIEAGFYGVPSIVPAYKPFSYLSNDTAILTSVNDRGFVTDKEFKNSINRAITLLYDFDRGYDKVSKNIEDYVISNHTLQHVELDKEVIALFNADKSGIM